MKTIASYQDKKRGGSVQMLDNLHFNAPANLKSKFTFCSTGGTCSTQSTLFYYGLQNQVQI